MWIHLFVYCLYLHCRLQCFFFFFLKLVKQMFINELHFRPDKHYVIKGFAINSTINDAKAVEFFSVSLNRINC